LDEDREGIARLLLLGDYLVVGDGGETCALYQEERGIDLPMRKPMGMGDEGHGMKARRAKAGDQLSEVLRLTKSLYTEWLLPRLDERIFIESVPDVSSLTSADKTASTTLTLDPNEEVVHIPREYTCAPLLDR